MAKGSKKRPSTTEEDESKPKKAKGRKTAREESEQSDKLLAGDDEVVNKIKTKTITKPSAAKLTPKNGKKEIKYGIYTSRKKKEEKRKLEVEAIVAHTKYNKGSRKYRIKWKGNHKDTWETFNYLCKKSLDLLRAYNKDIIQNESLVEAITAHKKERESTYYRIKWTDKSKGVTWESKKTVKKTCPKMLLAYTEKEERKDEVEDIVQHKLVKGVSRYLIKWKDSDSKTWETARRTVAICPAILDKFTKKNPDCNPVIYDSTRIYVHGSELLKTTKIFEGRKNHENKEWEVNRIVDVRIKEDKSREFLIRWKGYKSKYDSWEPEEHLDCADLITKYMDAAAKAKNTLHTEKRPRRKQTEPIADINIDADN